MFKVEMQYIVSEERVGADVGSSAMSLAMGHSPIPFVYRAEKVTSLGLSLADVPVCTHTHAQMHAPRGETSSTGVVGLAPKAWSEIKYQECAG